MVLCFDEDNIEQHLSRSNTLSKKEKLLSSQEVMVTRLGSQVIFKITLDFIG